MTDQQSTKESTFASTFAVLTAVVAFLLAGVAVVAVSTTESTAAVSTGGPTTIEVKLSEFKIEMTPATAPPGKITLHVVNVGSQVHNVDLPALTKNTVDLAPGAAATLDLGQVVAGSYDVICTIPGHEAAGMKTALVIGSGGAAAGSSSAAMDHGPSASANPDDAKIDFSAAPGPDFTARDPNAPPPAPGTVHDITFEAGENILEVAPGVTQEMWTFNVVGQPATVPGPILRGKLGDTFRVTIVNKGKVDHSMDFHASKVAWSDEMRNIPPGQSLVYEFTANYAGAYMYHCGTAPALHHIGNGMYGALIIDPPELAPVDHEFVMVQSELYTGPEGKPGDLAKMTSNDYDAVVFNGYVSQYKFKPIRVEPDQRVRVWVIDDGPNENSSFHIVGTIFDTVFKEGSYLLQPDARRGGSQALDLQPAQGGFVEFTLAEKGFYVMVSHKFSTVGKGAMGLFQAGDAEMPTGGGGH